MFRNILYIAVFFYNLSNCFSQTGWNLQTSNINQDLHSVKFINSNTGWCVGDSGVILKTTNGGTNWFSQSSGFKNNLRSLSMTSGNIGYIGGDSGLILKTTNGGLNWVRITLNPDLSLTSVFFVNDSIGYIGGINKGFNIENFIYRTVNGGTTWDSSLTNQSNTSCIYFINQYTGWCTGSYNIISGAALYKTINSGDSWFFQHSTSDFLSSVFFIDSLNGWLSGNYLTPTIFRTTNGGTSWFSEFPGLGYTVNSIYAVNTRKAWAVSEGGAILYTTNGGVNWSNQFINPREGIYNSIYFSDSLTGWIVGVNGIIAKTTSGGVLTNFSNISSTIPVQHFLSQNYPNPFNPKTIVSYKLGFWSLVKLKIYNILGNEVLTLVNERKPSGKYEVEFDADNLPSGIYLYSLIVNENTIDTKRMVLLK
ncbi:MAG: T9SS type A sorting domain-containing protein [Ignavibacteria bacterium]|nr:T9SS type A sorting domain-containing protein [Ignavibacteria bacterium]